MRAPTEIGRKDRRKEHEQIRDQGGAGADYNPEMDIIGKHERDGIQAEKFLLITMTGENVEAVVINGMTIMNLALCLSGKQDESGSVLKQARVIADGLDKAWEIKRQYDRERHARDLAAMLSRAEE